MRKTNSKKRKHLAKKTGRMNSLKKQRSLLIFFAVAVIITSGALFIKSRQERLVFPKLPPPPADALYRQPSQPINARVQDLLSRMTLEEKIGQMALVDKKSIKHLEDISTYGLGGVLSGAGSKPTSNTPEGWLAMVESMKKQSTKSRLGIPILYGIDANHGHANVPGATVFPHAIGLGASGDTQLVESVARASSEEVKSTGINWSYSPSLDAPRDIRWGRVYEAFSEDPALNAKLGSAYIKGTQGHPSSNDVFILGTAKHYLGTGSMVWGKSNHKKFMIDQGKIPANQQTLDSEFLPPFKAAIGQDVSSVMVALTDYGDSRIIDDKYLLTDKLKDELGFKGFVVSDWYGAYEYSGVDPYEANVSTVNAGLDMVMLPFDYTSFIRDVRKAVKKGKINQARIDDAVGRILTQKFKAGLFDAPKANISIASVGSKEHRVLARNSVSASAVLLKNNNSLLPLSKYGGQILVAGSGADNVGRQSGAWTVEWQGVDGNWIPGGTSILQGIRQVVGNNGATVLYDEDGKFPSQSRKAEVGVAVISEKPYAEGLGDNAEPKISNADLAAIEKLKQSSQHVVVIMLTGRPLIISDQIDSWDGAIVGWLPGSEGAGLADVLFGDKPFSASLPITWPASIRQVPIDSAGTTKDGTQPLFQRGFGLQTQ